jgi:hypothetical protein
MDDFDKVLAYPADPVPRPDGVPPLATTSVRAAASEFAAKVMSDADALAYQRAALARPPELQAPAAAGAVVFVPEAAPWPGECTNAKYVEILRAPTTLAYELLETPGGGCNVKIHYSLDAAALEQVGRCVKLERAPHIQPERLPVAIDFGPDAESNRLRMQVRVDMDLLAKMRETGAFPYLPSSVFEPVEVVETVIDVDIDPLVQVKFDFDESEDAPSLKISIDEAAEALYKNLGWYSESDYKSMTAVNSLDYADEVQTAPYTDATPMGSPPDTDRDRYERAQAMRENKASSTISKHLKKKMVEKEEELNAATKIQAIQRGKADRKRVEAKKIEKEETKAAVKIQSIRRGQVSRRPKQEIDDEQRATVGFRGLQALSDSKQREGEASTEQQLASTEDFTVVQTVQQVRRVKLPVKHKGKLVMREFVVVDHHHIHHHHHFHHDSQAQNDHKEQMRALEYKAQASVDPPPPTSLPVGQGGPTPPPPKEKFGAGKGPGPRPLKGAPNPKMKKGAPKGKVLPPIAR